MPKQTFFNLSEEKKQTLIKAAQKEFSRVSLSEASVANIVKDAGIPRGSFYQYFEDKEDLYFYLLDNHAKESQQRFLSCFKKNNGDLFTSMSEMFQTMLEELDAKDLQSFYRNIFLNLDYRTEKAFLNSVKFNSFNKQYDEIKHVINSDNLNATNNEELMHIVQIVVSVMVQNFVLKFAKELSNEQLIRNYQIQIDLLKRGFYKDGE